jgi:DNA-binding NtrC family response regulator
MLKSTTILVVDDETAIRRMVRVMLLACGYQDVLEAASADEALEISEQRRRPFDLLLSDVILGVGWNGVTLAREITAARPDTKVLLMSGDTSPDNLALPEGWGFIQKPFMLGALLQSVESVLAKPSGVVNPA